MRTYLPLVLSVLALCACYHPTPAHFQCGDAPHVCPDGQSCISGCCGGPPCGRVADAGVPQDGPPISPTDGAQGSGCANGQGSYMGEGMWACPAIVSKGDVRKKCAPGFIVPTVSSIPAKGCAALVGFYVADALGSDPDNPPTNPVCQWSGQPQVKQRFIFGCGNGPGTYATGPCGSFPRAAHCDPGDGTIVGPTDWDCPLGSPVTNQDFDNVSSTGVMDGVLCWHP